MTNLADGSAFSLAAFFTDNWGELILIGMAAIKAIKPPAQREASAGIYIPRCPGELADQLIIVNPKNEDQI